MQLLEHLLYEEEKKHTSAEFQNKIKTEPKIAPFEWFEYNLCQLFNCTPSQLDNEDYHHLMDILIMHNTYSEIEERHTKLKEQMKGNVSKHLTIALELEKLKK